jgi:hypothetical protein
MFVEVAATAAGGLAGGPAVVASMKLVVAAAEADELAAVQALAEAEEPVAGVEVHIVLEASVAVGCTFGVIQVVEL